MLRVQGYCSTGQRAANSHGPARRATVTYRCTAKAQRPRPRFRSSGSQRILPSDGPTRPFSLSCRCSTPHQSPRSPAPLTATCGPPHQSCPHGPADSDSKFPSHSSGDRAPNNSLLLRSPVRTHPDCATPTPTPHQPTPAGQPAHEPHPAIRPRGERRAEPSCRNAGGGSGRPPKRSGTLEEAASRRML